MIITTSICANYLPKAMALAESVKRCNPDHRFVLCLVEREVPPEAAAFAAFDQVVLSKDLGIDGFASFMFRHSIVEASTAVKGHLFEHLFLRFPDESRFVYLDPDTYVYSDLCEVEALLGEHPIIIAPHLLKPGHIEMELSSLKHGAFNLGFLAVNRSEEAQRFIRWWSARLSRYCYDDIAAGIFTDQKWINLAPCFFDTYILKHPGYDFATWTLKTSAVEREGEQLTVDGQPLRFVHFSGYDSGTVEWAMREWLPADKPVFRELAADYSAVLATHDADSLSQIAWSYQHYESGEKIEKQARYIWREVGYDADPFTLSNAAIHALQPQSAAENGEQQPDVPQQEPPKAADEKLLRKAMRVLREEGVGSLFVKTHRYVTRPRS